MSCYFVVDTYMENSIRMNSDRTMAVQSHSFYN